MNKKIVEMDIKEAYMKDNAKCMEEIIKEAKDKHMQLYYESLVLYEIAGDNLSDEELETYKRALKKFDFIPYNRHACFPIKNDVVRNMGIFKNKKNKREYYNKFFKKFKKEFMQYSSLSCKSSLSDESYFYNMIKLMLLFCTRGIKIETDETFEQAVKYQNYIISLFMTFERIDEDGVQWDAVNKIIIDNYGIDENYNNIDDLIRKYLEYILTYDIFFRTTEDDFNEKEPFENMSMGYFLLLVKCMINEIGSWVTVTGKLKESKIIVDEYKQKKDTYDIKINELQKENEILNYKLSKALKNLRMYIDSYNKQGFSNAEELKAICNNDCKKEEKNETSEADKCTIQKLNNALIEMERENNKLRVKLEKSVEDNNNLYEELKSIMPEDSDENINRPEIQIKEVDKNLKYAFVLKNKAPLEVEKELLERFPNSMIVKEQNVLNKSIDLVVLLTKFMSHSLYQGAKKICKDNGIPCIHCANINIDKIEDAIWNYYNAS